MKKFIKMALYQGDSNILYDAVRASEDNFTLDGIYLINTNIIDGILYKTEGNFITIILSETNTIWQDEDNTVMYEYYDTPEQAEDRFKYLNKILCEE